MRKRKTTGGQPALDGAEGVQYGGSTRPIAGGGTVTVRANDNPSVQLVELAVEAAKNETFEVYLMYRPGSEGARWVTLARSCWKWQGSASRPAGGTWTTSGRSENDPAGVESTAPPEWRSALRAIAETVARV